MGTGLLKPADGDQPFPHLTPTILNTNPGVDRDKSPIKPKTIQISNSAVVSATKLTFTMTAKDLEWSDQEAKKRPAWAKGPDLNNVITIEKNADSRIRVWQQTMKTATGDMIVIKDGATIAATPQDTPWLERCRSR